MDELMDLLVTDKSPSQASDMIKDILYNKSSERIQSIRPNVASSIFDQDVDLDADDSPEEVSAELDSDINLDSGDGEQEE